MCKHFLGGEITQCLSECLSDEEGLATEAGEVCRPNGFVINRFIISTVHYLSLDEMPLPLKIHFASHKCFSLFVYSGNVRNSVLKPLKCNVRRRALNTTFRILTSPKPHRGRQCERNAWPYSTAIWREHSVYAAQNLTRLIQFLWWNSKYSRVVQVLCLLYHLVRATVWAWQHIFSCSTHS